MLGVKALKLTIVASTQPSVAANAAGIVSLSNAAGDTAAISLRGAQALSWSPVAGGEQLYCSRIPVVPGRAVRGGVPVCFPQFGNCGPLAKHGFARTAVWQLHGAPITGEDAQVASATFSLQDSPLTQAQWPFGFALLLQVRLGAGFIEWSLQVANTGAKAFDFTAALHTYLAVANVQQVAVHGLASVPYLDAMQQNAKAINTAPLLYIADETDRVYLAPPPSLDILRSGLPHMRIDQAGFADTVIWNPGPAKAAALGDMPATDWRRMLCVEAAQVEHPVHLLPGTEWQGSQRLTLIAQQA
jgi:glucose-6-phosphate 1-epimerase